MEDGDEGKGEIPVLGLQDQADRNLLMMLVLSGVLLFNVPVLVIAIWFLPSSCVFQHMIYYNYNHV